jgi:hypothetical protein
MAETIRAPQVVAPSLARKVTPYWGNSEIMPMKVPLPEELESSRPWIRQDFPVKKRPLFDDHVDRTPYKPDLPLKKRVPQILLTDTPSVLDTECFDGIQVGVVISL